VKKVGGGMAISLSPPLLLFWTRQQPRLFDALTGDGGSLTLLGFFFFSSLSHILDIDMDGTMANIRALQWRQHWRLRGGNGLMYSIPSLCVDELSQDGWTRSHSLSLAYRSNMFFLLFFVLFFLLDLFFPHSLLNWVRMVRRLTGPAIPLQLIPQLHLTPSPLTHFFSPFQLFNGYSIATAP